VTLPASPIWLASSPDGRGPLCTDDQATVTFVARNRPAQSWTHRFAGADRRAIECLPPQPLALPPGAYEVGVTLEDVYPNTFGSRPYYLVFAARGDVSPVTPAMASPTKGSPLPTPPERAAVPASTPVAPMATTARREVLPTAAAIPVPLDTQRGASSIGERHAILLPAGVAALLIAVLLLARRRTRAAAAGTSPIAGVFYLFDQETREARTEMLRDDPRPLVVRRRPLRVAALGAEQGAGIGEIRRSVDGLVLYETAADTTAPLVHNTLYTLAGGTVTLRYRSMSGAQGARPRR
jgi:hypothetical protein